MNVKTRFAFIAGCDCCRVELATIRSIELSPAHSKKQNRPAAGRFVYTCERRCWPQLRPLLMRALLEAEI